MKFLVDFSTALFVGYASLFISEELFKFNYSHIAFTVAFVLVYIRQKDGKI